MTGQQMILQELVRNEDDRPGSLVETYHIQTTRTGIWIFWGAIIGAILIEGLLFSQLVWPLYLSIGDDSFASIAARIGAVILSLFFSLFFPCIAILQFKAQFFFVMPLHRKNDVVLYTNGLIDCKGRKKRLVTWDQVRSVDRQACKCWLAWRRSYRLNLEGTVTMILSPGIAHLDELGAAMEREIVTRHLPQMQADYAANKPIVFPGLCVNQQGISNSDESLPWEAVERISFGVEYLTIKKRESGKDWFVAPIVQFRNACLLEALLAQIREEKGFG